MRPSKAEPSNRVLRWVRDSSQWRLALCASLVAAVFLASLDGIRFVTVDDIWIALSTWAGNSISAGYSLAEQHGRLFKPSSVAMFVPYVFDSSFYFLLTYLGPIVLAAVLAGKLLRYAVPVKGAGVFFVLVFFALAQNSSENNLFSAVPFVWEMTWVTLLMGAIALVVAIERESIGWAIGGALIYLIGMVEGFVPHIVMLGLIAVYAPPGFRRNFRYFLPYLVAFVFWMIAWVIWRQMHPSQYEGSSISGSFSVLRIARTILVYGMGGAPFATLINGVVVANWQTFREGLGIVWLLKAAGVAAGIVYFVRMAAVARWMPGWKLIAALVVLIFLPIVLVGLTPKYQYWVEVGSRAYVHSHYAYFAWVALIVVLLIAFAPRLRSPYALGVVACLGAAGSIVTDWSNYEINLQQKLSARKWDTVDMFLQSRAFAAIPVGASVAYRGLDQSRSIVLATDANYWSTYLREKGRKNAPMMKSEVGTDYRHASYYLTFIEESRGDSQYIIVAPLELAADSTVPTGRLVSIIANTSNESLTLIGGANFSDAARAGNILVNGQVVSAASENFSIQLPLPWNATTSQRVFDVEFPEVVDLRSLKILADRDPFSDDYAKVVRAERDVVPRSDVIFTSQE